MMYRNMNIRLQRATHGVMQLHQQKFHYVVRNIIVRKIAGTHSKGARMSDH